MKKALIAIAVLGIVLLAAFLTAPVVMWSGQVTRPISITVKDADGKVVRNATVMLIQNLDDRLKPEMSSEKFSEHLLQTRHLFVSDEKGSGS